MMKMYWNDQLAGVAQKWANQCPSGHDTGAQRFVKEIGKPVGQNMAMGGGATWKSGIQSWYDEVKDFKYGQEAESYLGTDGWKKIGHFTQVVQRGSYLVGCGYAECSISHKKFFVCNYAGPNWDTTKPYTSGTKCAACQNHCKGGLCDCEGRICLNGGTLNIDTCLCTCPRLYGGTTCQTELCNGKKCENDGTLDTTTCNCDCKLPNGGATCTELLCGGKSCQNGGALDASTCKCGCKSPYEGDTCADKKCPAKDPSHCGTDWPKTFCKKYSNVPEDCPNMCGGCP